MVVNLNDCVAHIQDFQLATVSQLDDCSLCLTAAQAPASSQLEHLQKQQKEFGQQPGSFWRQQN